MISKLEFLQEHPMFAYLTDEEVEALNRLSRELEYEDGAVVAFQGDIADSMYIVKSGRLYSERRSRGGDEGAGHVLESKNYLPGDHFGDKWMFDPDIHTATVRATSLRGEPATVVVITRDSFLRFAHAFPQAIPNLEPVYDEATDEYVEGFTPEAWEEAQKIKAKEKTKSTIISVLPNELLEFTARRSRYYLLVRLLWPTVGLVLFTTVVYVLLAIQPTNTIFYSIRNIVTFVIAGFFLFIIVFRFFDWRNDYFVITNKRVVHREFSLRTFRIDIKTARINQIQSVETTIPTIWANMFNFGDAVIATASQFGTIIFDSIDDPLKVKDVLNRLSQRVDNVDIGREQTVMRRSLQGYFQAPQNYRVVEEADISNAPLSTPTASGTFMRSFRKSFYWRIEENGVVTYRKHYIVLFFHTALQLGVFALMFLIFYLILEFSTLPINLLLPIFALIFLMDFAWFIWRVEDWRNDIFQVTSRTIIDIDRRPFGFGESRKQAPIDKIQNVNAYTPGLLHTVFNYGNVDIETAGDAINLQFDDVPYPSIIQSDIFQRLDDLKESEFEKDTKIRHREYGLLLDVYQQSIEQQLIPQRTPPEIPAEEEPEL